MARRVRLRSQDMDAYQVTVVASGGGRIAQRDALLRMWHIVGQLGGGAVCCCIEWW